MTTMWTNTQRRHIELAKKMGMAMPGGGSQSQGSRRDDSRSKSRSRRRPDTKNRLFNVPARRSDSRSPNRPRKHETKNRLFNVPAGRGVSRSRSRSRGYDARRAPTRAPASVSAQILLESVLDHKQQLHSQGAYGEQEHQGYQPKKQILESLGPVQPREEQRFGILRGRPQPGNWRQAAEAEAEDAAAVEEKYESDEEKGREKQDSEFNLKEWRERRQQQQEEERQRQMHKGKKKKKKGKKKPSNDTRAGEEEPSDSEPEAKDAEVKRASTQEGSDQRRKSTSQYGSSSSTSRQEGHSGGLMTEAQIMEMMKRDKKQSLRGTETAKSRVAKELAEWEEIKKYKPLKEPEENRCLAGTSLTEAKSASGRKHFTAF